jgi:hypothetical protein
VEIDNILPPTFNSIAGDVSCYGDDNGFIFISMIDYVLPLSFLWSNGAVSQSLSNAEPGTYIVTITDGTSLSVSDTFVITEPDSMALSYSSENILCFGDQTGSIDIEVSGGTQPYFYLWSNGSLQEDIDQLNGGNYIVSVTDAHSCLVTQYVYIEQSPQLVVNFIVDDISTASAGDGAISLSMFGGTAPYTFQWSNGSSHQNLTMLEQGYYSLTVSDANNCESIFDSIFIFEPYPVISGKVYMGPNPAPQGIVLLFKEFQDEHIEAIDYSFISTGNYSFSVPPDGKYLIYALPSPDYGINVYPLYFPTYFTADIEWAGSVRIETETDFSNTDIHLSSYQDIFYGPAEISGNLSYSDPAVYEQNIFDNNWFNDSLILKSSSLNPARNIPILLLHENQQPVLYTLTNGEGNFHLSNVEYGEYILRAEKAGYESEEIPISLSANQQSTTNIQLFIQPSEIVVSIAEDGQYNSGTFLLHPNPVNDYMMIQLPVSGNFIREILIYSMDGRKKITLPGNEIHSKSILEIKTNELRSGVYLLYILTTGGNNIKRKFIKM